MKNKLYISFILAVIILFSACSGSKYLNMKKVKTDLAVKIIYRDGKVANGIITEKSPEKVEYISEADHQSHSALREDILRIERLDVVYDLDANPISTAEIEKYKNNKNTWGYALGGAVIGGAAGLVVGLPFWYADVGNVPPYFTAGAGAVVGSILFAIRGQDKDKEEAVQKIRYVRKAEKNLEEEVEQEKQRLQKIEEEKQKLKEELVKKK
ncbi:MAG: hypothetical protein P8Y60_18280 [Calditrichota bacterium]